MIAARQAKRVGLLATQGIRSSVNREVLKRIKESGNIFWAQFDRPWTLEEGAAVRVSMIGFDDGTEQIRMLDDRSVTQINSDLSSSLDLTSLQRLTENGGLAFVGSQKIGPFDITAEIAQEMLSAQGNPNRRPNSDVVKPLVNGSDMMGHSRNAWIIDFGVDMTEADAALYEMPFEYIKQHVYPERATNRRESYARKWWQHGEARPGMRVALKGLSRFIVTSRVARHRVFAWLEQPVLPDHKLCVFARDDDYFFGVLHSRIHAIWALHAGARHGVGNDLVYTVGDCFETFPLSVAAGAGTVQDLGGFAR